MIDEALKKLIKQIDIEFTNAGAREVDVIFQPRPAGKIDNYARQRFIKRHIGMTVASNTGLVAQRLCDGLTERDADVFYRVVGVDIQVAGGLQFDIDHAMTRDLVNHVIEEWNSRVEFRFAFSIEIDGNADLCFFGVAGDVGGSHKSWQKIKWNHAMH